MLLIDGSQPTVILLKNFRTWRWTRSTRGRSCGLQSLYSALLAAIVPPRSLTFDLQVGWARPFRQQGLQPSHEQSKLALSGEALQKSEKPRN